MADRKPRFTEQARQWGVRRPAAPGEYAFILCFTEKRAREIIAEDQRIHDMPSMPSEMELVSRPVGAWRLEE